MVVPDTNALIAEPDPRAYEEIAGVERFTLVLLPTVLAELDNLKVVARDEALREKVGKVIRRIKGWRGQGRLTTGITVDGTICVRAVATEPRMGTTLEWLDPENNDDRIVASVIELQSAAPRAGIVLVTSDINLQNKAEVAKLPYAETP